MSTPRQGSLTDRRINRRDFLKLAGRGVAGGVAILVVGSRLEWLEGNPAYAATVHTLDFHMTDAMKQMVTHNSINDARCYFWIYKSVVPDLMPECPGPIIFATRGDTVQIRLTNDLDEAHAFSIPGMVSSGPIAPGQTVTLSFTATTSGAHLYYDNLNEPVNRVMGLHGAFIVMPTAAVPGHKFTPYDNPTPHVQAIYDAFGSPVFPGLAWEQADAATGATPFRTYIWLCHQASPNLFAEVGGLPPGEIYPAAQFQNAFLRDPFSPTNANRMAQYFTMNGQSGHFVHGNPLIAPNLRVGEPCLIHVLNAGLWTHSLHIHANHFYVTSVNGAVSPNPLWVDVYNIEPMDRIDYTEPYMRPPDVPNARGIGRADNPLTCIANPLIPGSAPHPVWPPTEEINSFFPALGTTVGTVPIHVQLSPLCYPAHDHSEPSQTAQGGNYNLGLIGGQNFTGDRNTPGGVTTFPNNPNMCPPNETREAAPEMEHEG